jgi:predicted metalloprotease with PDZ domain
MRIPWLALTALLASNVHIVHAQETVDYLVRVDDPGSRLYHVEATLPATGDTTFVSLPSWTPGHYELEDYARYVQGFGVTDDDGSALRWDKVDKDTWRIASGGAAHVRVVFDFLADTVNLSGSLLKRDFGFFNGTNFFVYPETGYDFASQVRFELPQGWRVATELTESGAPDVYTAANYHELVDNPTFVGYFAMDSVLADGRWIRLALYPPDQLKDPAKELVLDALQKIADYSHDLFGEPPYDRYTTLIYLATEPIIFFGGLEHADSHLDILPAVAFNRPEITFRAFLYRLLSHEFYHAWNVKRIRPTEIWPYEYDREQYTPLLWVSEGITDYYAQLMEGQPAIEAVEDASINTWINPTFIAGNYYYDKGALIGLLLDVMIRDATDNEHSLDDVMARLYREHYLRDRGFATDEILSYLGEYIGEDTTRSFYHDYIDGREPLPYQEILARAGVRYAADTIVEPFFGVEARSRGRSVVVRGVEDGSEAARIGLRPGDVLYKVGAVRVTDIDWGDTFREFYADSIGQPIEVQYLRNGEEQTVKASVSARTRYGYHLEPLPNPNERQLGLKKGLLSGATGGM